MPPWSPSSIENYYYPPEFVSELRTKESWLEMAKWVTQPLLCRVVKVLMTPDDKVYFMNTGRLDHHYTFLKNMGLESRPLAEFNDVVYSGHNRDLICATIVKYGEFEDAGNAFPWTFEIVATDPLLPETSGRVAFTLEKIQEAFSIGNLNIRATSHHQIENLRNPNHPLAMFPQVEPMLVWQGKTHGCIVSGVVNGRLRYIHDISDADAIESLTIDDIAFFAKGIPNDLPPVAGVVFAEPLPPLCHIAIICQNRGTPCCFDTKPETAQNCLERTNTDVTFACNTTLSYANISDMYSSYGSRNINTIASQSILKPDAASTLPVRFGNSIKNLPSVSLVGAKARQCYIVNLVTNQTEFHSKSFAIPMGAYMQHSKVANSVIAKLIARYPIRRSTKFPTLKDVKGDATKIRELILTAPIDRTILNAVKNMMKECQSDQIILRSSTNAEDIPGFTGAGLYKSVHLNVASMDSKTLEEAIKIIWASVWLPSAFLERLRFGIDSECVGMSVLVQPYYSSDSLIANGVAVTSNPFNKHKYGVYVTTFPGGANRATDSVSQVLPEESIVHMSRILGSFEVELVAPLRGPEITSTEPIFDTKIMEELGRKCARLHKELLGQDVHTSLQYNNHKAIDIEWLLLKENNQIMIIQARPCRAAE